MVRDFARFAHRTGSGTTLCAVSFAVADLGIVDADLGGGLVKLRLAKPNEGRSGGYRTIRAYQVGSDVFFLYGFAKNESENIQPHELTGFRRLGHALMDANAETIDIQLNAGRILEIVEEE